ncbi:CAMK family protein kinase [Tritrichomonas foetus]|uniref:CAMK family protein kinase n=1 Tax=Tritrichomonas foetus TaxID=1144522 RepID=A0A1J4J5R2_9EUKA|nr:CAMK family protein kinase [Tritrichomonas foetus]|eukprot:OHS93487.1 CAMK family protein kinase [Tritrichomonas foetus]
MKRSTMINQRARAAFESEMKILEASDHPFISLFYNMIESELYFYLIIELANRGTLSSYIQAHGALIEPKCVKIFAPILSAINYMHQILNIIHRDIKPDNILFDDFFNIRLIDFGLSKIVDPDSSMVQTTCGTFPFTAPEIIRHVKYDKEVDVWSLGVCLYMMAVGELPFNSTNQKVLFEQILNDEPNYPSNLSPNLVDLLKKMLTKDPAERIKTEEIANHKWVASSKYSFFLSDNFMFHPDYRVQGEINEKIATLMEKNNFNRENYNVLGTAESMFYRIMRKTQILGILRALRALNSKSERKSINLIPRPNNEDEIINSTKKIAMSSSLDLQNTDIVCFRFNHDKDIPKEKMFIKQKVHVRKVKSKNWPQCQIPRIVKPNVTNSNVLSKTD